MISAACSIFGKQTHEFIFERYYQVLDMMGSYKSLKDALMMLQSESPTAPNDVITAFNSFAQTWYGKYFNEIYFETISRTNITE